MINTLIANRYEPLDVLGKGGMGRVYCVKDRLSSRLMALKQVLINTNQLHFHLSGTQSSPKLALAMEFRTLASLQHPHIVGVADYGFDNERQPYFTMEYLRDAQTIVAYAQEQSDEEKLRLLAETLEALAYLHQLDVIHRDLKPENVLVNQSGQIKVADFGLAVAADYQVEDLGGTLAYMAPEVFTEDMVSIQSDLFAVGVMAYEIFVGQHPYDNSSTTTLIDDILACQPDFSEMNSEVEPFVKSLMAKSPNERPANAKDALTQLSRLSDRPIPIERRLIRESFLQHATFVGREEELDRLKDSLHNQSEHSWLIGGESGVGKSRLLDELRVHALVDGHLVLRGYEVEENSLPYQLWRDIVRRLVLIVEVSDAEAAVLKEIAPDIANLLGRTIPDAPELTGTASQQRLTTTILNLFRRLQRPTLLLLEDLQWMEESLFILQRLNTIIDELSLVIIASYRDDERSDLPQDIPSMQVLQLDRLSQDQIATLASTIIGSSHNQQRLTEKLHEQTEGNVFFLVEVLRALAEQGGGLNKVPESDISTDILTSGIRALLQRRINRISPEYQTFLNYVALAGRYLEMDLVSYLHQHNEMAFPLDSWLQACSDAAIIEYVEEEWRFRHDKLRDATLEDMQEVHQSTLHRQIAEALETLHPNDNSYNERFYQHWQASGDISRTLHYLTPFADDLIYAFARYDYAIDILKTNLGKLSESHPQYPRFANQLSLTYRMKGDQETAKNYGEVALRLSQRPIDRANSFSNLSMVFKNLGDDVTAWDYASQSLAIHRQIDDLLGIARSLNNLGIIVDDQGKYDVAFGYYEEAKPICIDIDNQSLLASTLSNQALIYERQGKYEESFTLGQESLNIREEIGDRYGIGVSLNNLGSLAGIMGKNEVAIDYLQQSLSISREIGDREGISYALMNLGIISQKLNQYDEAENYYQQSLEILEQMDDKFGIANAFSNMGFTYLAQGNIDKASVVWHQSLEMAHSNEWLPILMETLVGIAHLRLESDILKEAVQLARLVSTHPGTLQATKEEVLAPLLEILATKLGKEKLDSALSEEGTIDLDEFVKKIFKKKH